MNADPYETIPATPEQQIAFSTATRQEAIIQLELLQKQARPPVPLPGLPVVMQFDYSFLPTEIWD